MRGALCLNDVNNGKYQHFMEITDFLILTIIILSTENRKKKVIGKEHHGMCKNKILHFIFLSPDSGKRWPADLSAEQPVNSCLSLYIVRQCYYCMLLRSGTVLVGLFPLIRIQKKKYCFTAGPSNLFIR